MKVKDSYSSNIVNFSYSNQEYANFYERHKALCDEITGSKLVVFKHLKTQEEKEISPINFILGIKRLQAFIINYAHSFDERSKEREIFSLMFKLEENYNNDEEYASYCDNASSLSYEKKARFSKLYYEYLFRCFDIIVKAGGYLQSSMMIGTKNIKKLIEWYDTKPFFDKLGEYREEVSNVISNFVVSDVELHYKKVLGYHYTYRLFVDYKELNQIDKLIKLCNKYIFDEEYIKFVFKAKDGKVSKDKLKEENVLLKQALFMIIKLTNKSLSGKNILPKINRKVIFDKTGI